MGALRRDGTLQTDAEADEQAARSQGPPQVPRGRKQFTVTVGTIFEDSHIPISKQLLAIHLLSASKKGM